MTRKQLFYKVLVRWVSDLHVLGRVDDVFKQSVEEDLDADDFHNAISLIKSVANDSVSSLMLQQMDLLQSSEEAMNEDIVTTLSFLQDDVAQYRLYCYKEFAFNSPNGDLSVVTSSMIKATSSRGNMSEAEWKVLELILLKNYTNSGFITGFIDDVQNKDIVYALTSLHETDVWRLYAYSYLCHTNKDSIAIPAELSYPASNKFAASIPYIANVKYEQYFDAYHVMNESKHVNDLLNRYLRMYQILELFVYRNILCEIADANSRNSAFVRNVIKYTHKAGDKEKSQFIDGFTKVFNGVDGVITKTEIDPYNAFLDRTYLIKSGTPHSANKIGTIIYALRNSVVHNKESELHFSFGNISEYRDGIGLIKLIIEKMENEIVTKINTVNSPIEYPKETMPLY